MAIVLIVRKLISIAADTRIEPVVTLRARIPWAINPKGRIEEQRSGISCRSRRQERFSLTYNHLCIGYGATVNLFKGALPCMKHSPVMKSAAGLRHSHKHSRNLGMTRRVRTIRPALT